MNVKTRIIAIADHYGLSVRKLEEAGGFERGKLSSIKDTITSDKLSRIIDKFPDIDIYIG